MDLNRYKKEIQNIKEYAIKNNVPEDEINKVFKDCFHLLEARTATRVTTILKFFKYCCTALLLLIFSILILYNHPKTHNVLLRNVQNFIYPGLRVFRKLAVPVVKTYPSLTEWYDEWCLVENPYFQVDEMDCQPCSSVESIHNLSGYNITPTFNTAVPFIRNEKIENVDVNKLIEIYINYKDSFDMDAEIVTFDKKSYRKIHNPMFNEHSTQSISSNNGNIKWRVNRMEPGRKLREFFPKLPGIPDWWSPSTEKFVFIDESKASAYNLPNPECANVIIQCTNGERLINMIPSVECTHNCRNLSIILKAHHSLWYNWWYWRPVSLPLNSSTSTSIMYLTSFC